MTMKYFFVSVPLIQVPHPWTGALMTVAAPKHMRRSYRRPT